MDIDTPQDPDTNDIEQKLNSIFSSEFSSENSAITVMYTKGTARLEGAVQRYSDKIRAEIIAFRIFGVKKVVNRLLIVPSGKSTDICIARSVWQKISATGETENSQIDVEVCSEVLTLRGTVPSLNRYYQVYNAAKNALSGKIDHIVNRMLIVSE